MAHTRQRRDSLKGPNEEQKEWMQTRFRSFMPVVVDVETGGFNAKTDALLEIAAVLIGVSDDMRLYAEKVLHHHVEPFENANLEEESLKVNQIDPFHPLRMAKPEKLVLENLFAEIRAALGRYRCSRAILTGHNASFDLKFLNAAVVRNGIANNPFHRFSSFDTVTLGALAYRQTVLAKIADASGLRWDESSAHSAIYDAKVTAEIFCAVFNQYPDGRRAQPDQKYT